MTVIAALGGALVAAGLVLLASELTRRAPAPGTPPGPRPLRAIAPAASAHQRIAFERPRARTAARERRKKHDGDASHA